MIVFVCFVQFYLFCLFIYLFVCLFVFFFMALILHMNITTTIWFFHSANIWMGTVFIFSWYGIEKIISLPTKFWTSSEKVSFIIIIHIFLLNENCTHSYIHRMKKTYYMTITNLKLQYINRRGFLIKLRHTCINGSYFYKSKTYWLLVQILP
jgi:hypothetical protein